MMIMKLMKPNISEENWGPSAEAIATAT